MDRVIRLRASVRIAQYGGMSTTIESAVAFMACHARTVDRRRLHFLLGDDDAAGALDALDAHRNADGGYGWAIEPDLRSPESQPAGAMHAFEVMADVAPTITPRATELCNWLADHSIDNAGLPFALALRNAAGSAPWWKDPDTKTPSLHITTAVVAKALDVARHDDAVADHPWLAAATAWCLAQIRELTDPTSHELLFSMQLLDAATDSQRDADSLLDRLGRHLPADGVLPVTGGIEGEVFHPLDFAPRPDRPIRRFFSDSVIAADLDRLAAGQRGDGGWEVNFNSASPIGALEWRGYATVAAITVLRANARL